MGIDIQRIAKTESVPREHFCPVCQLLSDPNEALQSMCGHLYCKPCLTYAASTTRSCPYDGYLVTETFAKPLVESNKVLADTIGKTVVYCPYQNSGCTWVGALADSSFHCSGCDFGNSLVMCKWCGINIAHRQQREHVQVCLGAYTATDTTQASVAMATSQASVQGHALASTMMTQAQWYQPYQIYENYFGDYMQQQPMHQEGPSYHPHTALQEENQPIPPVLGVQPHMNNFSATTRQVGLGHVATSLPAVKEDDMQRTPRKVHCVLFGQEKVFHIYGNKHDEAIMEDSQARRPSESVYGVNRAAEVTAIKFDHKVKRKLTDGSVGTGHSSSIFVEGKKIKPLSKPSLTQQHRAASSTSSDHKQMHQEDPSYHPHTTLQEHHQPITSILGVQLHMNHFSATAPQVGLGHAAPILPVVKEDEMQRIPKQELFGQYKDDEAMEDSQAKLTSESAYGVNRTDEVTTIKFDHKLKGKLTDACDESVHRSSIVVDSNEIKSGPLSKQVLEENIGDGWEDLGETLLVETKCIKDDPPLNVTPLLNPTLLYQDGLQQLSNIDQHNLTAAEKSRAHSAESSLDRGYDQRSRVMTHEKHETGFELRPALRSSQPSMDLGEGQFRRGPRSPISEHRGVPSGGRYGLYRSEFKGLSNLQMGAKGDWSTKHVGSSDCHYQTKEHQQKSMDMVSMINHNEKKHTMFPWGSSRFGNQNKNEESRFKGSG